MPTIPQETKRELLNIEDLRNQLDKSVVFEPTLLDMITEAAPAALGRLTEQYLQHRGSTSSEDPDRTGYGNSGLLAFITGVAATIPQFGGREVPLRSIYGYFEKQSSFDRPASPQLRAAEIALILDPDLSITGGIIKTTALEKREAWTLASLEIGRQMVTDPDKQHPNYFLLPEQKLQILEKCRQLWLDNRGQAKNQRSLDSAYLALLAQVTNKEEITRLPEFSWQKAVEEAAKTGEADLRNSVRVLAQVPSEIYTLEFFKDLEKALLGILSDSVDVRSATDAKKLEELAQAVERLPANLAVAQTSLQIALSAHAALFREAGRSTENFNKQHILDPLYLVALSHKNKLEKTESSFLTAGHLNTYFDLLSTVEKWNYRSEAKKGLEKLQEAFINELFASPPRAVLKAFIKQAMTDRRNLISEGEYRLHLRMVQAVRYITVADPAYIKSVQSGKPVWIALLEGYESDLNSDKFTLEKIKKVYGKSRRALINDLIKSGKEDWLKLFDINLDDPLVQDALYMRWEKETKPQRREFKELQGLFEEGDYSVIPQLVEVLHALEPPYENYQPSYYREIRDLVYILVTSGQISQTLVDQLIRSKIIYQIHSSAPFTLEQQIAILKAPRTKTTYIEAIFVVSVKDKHMEELIVKGMEEGWIKDAAMGLMYLVDVSPADMVEGKQLQKRIEIQLAVWLKRLSEELMRETRQLTSEELHTLYKIKESQMWRSWIESLPITSRIGSLTKREVNKLLSLANE